MGKREETAMQDEDEILGFEKNLVLIIGCFVLGWVGERLKLFGSKGTGWFQFATVLSTGPNRFRLPVCHFSPTGQLVLDRSAQSVQP